MSNVEKVKTVPAAKREKAQKKGDKYYYASQWSLMMRKFRRHKLAMASTILLPRGGYRVLMLHCSSAYSTVSLPKAHRVVIACSC